MNLFKHIKNIAKKVFTKKVLLVVMTAVTVVAPLVGQTVGNSSAVYPNGIANSGNTLIASNRGVTNVTSPVGVSDTTINVASTTLFPGSLDINHATGIVIDNEFIKICGSTSTTFTVCSGGRGADGSTPTTHNQNTNVFEYVLAAHTNQLSAEVQAIENSIASVLAYNFAAQTPGGSLAVGNNTVTLAPVPLGVNGTDTNHPFYVSGGVGTAEVCLGNGGSATSGAASGTVIINCTNTHSGAWTIAPATNGFTEELTVAPGGTTPAPAGTYTLRAAIQLPTGTTLRGAGEGQTILKYANNALTATTAWQLAGHVSQYCGICLNDGSYQHVQDLTIDANGANQTWFYYGDINGVAVNHAVIDRVTVKNHVISGGTGVVVILSGTDDVIQNSSSIGIASCTVPNGGGAFYIAGSSQRILSSYATNYCDSPFVMANCDHCTIGDSVADVGTGQMATGTFDVEGAVESSIRDVTCLATGTNPNRNCIRITNVTSGSSAQSIGVSVHGVKSTHSSTLVTIGGGILGATTPVLETQLSDIHGDNTVLACITIGQYVNKLNITNSDLVNCGGDGIDITSTGAIAGGQVVTALTIDHVKIDHANGFGIFATNSTSGPVVNGFKLTNSYSVDTNASPIQTRGINLANGGTAINDVWIVGNTFLGNTLSQELYNTGFGANVILGPNIDSAGVPTSAYVQYTFTNLPAVPIKGSQPVYCVDCTLAATCASGGSGHLAVSRGDIWACQ